MSKSKSAKDPHAAREAQKYDNPVPSREFILDLLSEASGPLTHQQVCRKLKLDDEELVEGVRRRLIAMERDGQLMSNRRREYGPIDQLDLIRGRVQGHKDGYGFVVPFEGGDDLYLSNREMRRVFDGDEVLVRESGKFRGKLEGAIVEVLARNTHQVVGRYYADNGVGFVRPDNPRLIHDVLISEGRIEAEAGQFVVVEITQFPDRRQHPAGQILEVLGDHMAPGMEIDVAIRSHGIPCLWPGDVKAQADALDAEVTEADKKHRVDLRKLPLVTIDGEDARDFDDAVYCEYNGKTKGWRLYVAIADVSHYVTPGSPLDKEAEQRGTSVYFPDHVVPMLPEALSNGLCSLNPEVDRLALVCEMTISSKGKLSSYKFYEAVIHSHARLTYTQVGNMLDERDSVRNGPRDAYAHVAEDIDCLHDLYHALRSARDRRGAIDFETTETRIMFDQERKIEKIVPVQRNDAHKLIEECMLCANVSAAKFLEKLGIDALYRVHETPGEEKLTNLREFLGELGLNLPGGLKPSPGDYQKVLSEIKERSDAKIIQTVMLRSMKQAAYTPDNQGHFGLGYPGYAHFTSPIRRYPDLLVHRAIRSVVRGRGTIVEKLMATFGRSPVEKVKGAKPIPKAKAYPYDMAEMLRLGEHCSSTERRADEATREVVSWLKCEYLQDHVGEQFPGVISAVTGFGLFVELKDLYVEGLIHISALPHDYYHHEPAHHRLVGERTRKVFRLGDELTVQVVRVDLDERKVDFEFIEVNKSSRPARRGAKNSSAKGQGLQPGAKSKSASGKAKPNKNKASKDKPNADKASTGKPSGRKPRRRSKPSNDKKKS